MQVDPEEHRLRDHGRVRRQRAETRAHKAQIVVVEVRATRRARREQAPRAAAIITRNTPAQSARLGAVGSTLAMDAILKIVCATRQPTSDAAKTADRDGVDVPDAIGRKLDVARPQQLEQDAVAYCKCDDVRREGQRRLVEAAADDAATVRESAE